MEKRAWHLRNKWLRHKALEGSNSIRPYLPDTALLTRASLYRFLKKYRSVFVKPVYGKHGKEITKITRTTSGYRMQSGVRDGQVGNRGGVAMELREVVRGRPYLIQQGIELLSIRNRPVDFRALLVKLNRKWWYMGVIGKVAAPKRVVTNLHNGGRAVSLKRALMETKHASNGRYARVDHNMRSISTRVATRFGRKYKRARRIGIDVGLDTDLRYWILEVNTSPGYKLFKRHPNRQLYGKINRYMKRIR
jgi:glutathione synthase/RimK-type ligase-like ATP-grasp enzyme